MASFVDKKIVLWENNLKTKNKFITGFHGYVHLEGKPQVKWKGMKFIMGDSKLKLEIIKKSIEELSELEKMISSGIDVSYFLDDEAICFLEKGFISDLTKRLKEECLKYEHMKKSFLVKIDEAIKAAHKDDSLEKVNGKDVEDISIKNLAFCNKENYYVMGASDFLSEKYYLYHEFYCLFDKKGNRLCHTGFGGRVFPIDENNFFVKAYGKGGEGNYYHYQLHCDDWCKLHCFTDVNNIRRINNNLVEIYFNDGSMPLLYNISLGSVLLKNIYHVSANYSDSDSFKECLYVWQEICEAKEKAMLKFFIYEDGKIASEAVFDSFNEDFYQFDLEKSLQDNLLEISEHVRANLRKKSKKNKKIHKKLCNMKRVEWK